MLTESTGVFDPQHRALTVGILLGVTVVAFEGLAVVTVAPRFAEALGGLTLYGWVFSGFLLASLLANVVGGEAADRAGPGRPFTIGLLLFGGGLLLSGLAPNMELLLSGRVLQGLGGGAFSTAMYVAVNLAYPDALRPRMMALMSSAWVVPALIGPAAAGLIAEALSWRWVFLAIVPLLALVATLTFAAFQGLQRPAGEVDRRRLLRALRMVVGVGLLLYGLGRPDALTLLLLVAAGAALALPALTRLLPVGALRLASGLPSVVMSRGLVYAAFISVEAFLALMLTSVHGYAPVITGFVIATGAVSWTLGSWLQERLEQRWPRPRRIVLGSVLLTFGLSGQLLALAASFEPLAITVGAWMLSGLGIGLAHTTTSVLAFELAAKGEEGVVAASLQVVDNLFAALAAGVGGALFALALERQGGEAEGILFAFLASIVLVLLSVVAAWRIGAVPPPGGDAAR
jgi:MFS family permease